MKSWISTYTGRKFDPLNPRPEDVCLEDIAWSLAHQCRFTGHCKSFWSVADHSMLVAAILRERHFHVRIVLPGLFHDAEEAYVADLASPIKKQGEMQEYRAICKKVARVIRERFGIPWDSDFDTGLVNKADRDALLLEGSVLISNFNEWEDPNPEAVKPLIEELPYIYKLVGVASKGLPLDLPLDARTFVVEAEALLKEYKGSA